MRKMADFYTKVISDEKLRAQLGDILGNREITEASDEELKKIGELAKNAGFDITLEEAKAYLHAEVKDLSDEALDAVAGGVNKSGVTTCPGEDAGTRDIIHPGGRCGNA